MNRQNECRTMEYEQEDNDEDLLRIMDDEVLEKFASSHNWIWSEQEEKQFFESDQFKKFSADEIDFLKFQLKWMKIIASAE